MEETNAGDQPSKPDGDTDQPRSLPYSVETPYGFHLDLDFLKYVDDIEKGNTIRRVHIHRKAKQPKFSTLPRNFSLPENGSRAYAASSNKSWAAFAHRKTSLGAEETIHLVTTNESPPFVTPADEQSYRRKALLAETIRQAEVMRPEEDLASCRGRPQLLRASSMPATLPPTKNVEEESQCSEPSQLVSLPQPCDGKSFTEIPFSPAKESLDSNPKTTPELDHQPEAHPQEGKEVQSPQPSQPATVQELLMVTESGGEESETPTMETFAQLVKDVSSSPKLLDENENHEEIELNINEVMPSISEENEDRNVWARENGEFLGLESSVCHMVEPSTVTALKQHIAVLEEQLSTKTQELEHIRLVLKQQDDEIKEKERNIKTLASSKAQLEEKFCRENTQETKPCEQDGNALPYHDAAVNTELIGMDRLKESQDKGVNVNISVSTKSVGCGVDNMNLEVEKLSKMPIHTDQGLADVHAGIRKKGTAFLDKQKRTGTDIEPAVHTSCFTELQINEHIHDDCQSQRSSYDTESRVAPAPTGESYSGPDLKKGPAEDIKQVLMEEERHTDQQDSSDADPISQYVKKIQELLQEQWMCLEHGYPELASAIKQPASKLSSIQNQLVNSLNLLLSAYSTQASPEKENSNLYSTSSDYLSPTTSLKSIMKKKGHGFHAGGNGTKKNLQFVGVNGGYETTSSEDTSCEDSSSEGNSDCETERKYESVAHRQVRAADDRDCASPGIPQCTRHEGEELQEREDPTMASTQHKTDRHVFNSVCQEWFRVSSRKSSSPEIVAVYLREFQAIDPQLLKKIVNLADGNGNTALHYSVSHSNFLIVKLLLDTGVCDVDHQNKAGYTAVMITPLASAETDEDMEVVLKLLKFGNVNIRASQGGQTALMLGVSHDREDMVKALLSCEADINLKDDNGASALMVACQQGNAEIVKLLLAHPECDATLTDKLYVALYHPPHCAV
uniref:KN motif and ankyrin repeat domains 4 n=1 Tax=Crocodylus porosus TaxID=8502 RepID=A0A7M4EER0_CROPO